MIRLAGRQFTDDEVQEFFNELVGEEVKIRIYDEFKTYSLYLYHSCFKLDSDITPPKMSKVHEKAVNKAKNSNVNCPIFLEKTKTNNNFQDYDIYKKITKLRKNVHNRLSNFESNIEATDANHLQNIHFTVMDLLQNHFQDTPAEFSMIDVNFNPYMIGSMFTDTIEFMQKGIYVSDFSYLDFEDGYLTLSDKPIVHIMVSPNVKWDLRNQFHSANGPAIEIKTEPKKTPIKKYYLHGVELTKQYYDSVVKRKLTAQQVLSQENIEIRRVVMQFYGLENLLQELQPKVLDTSERGNELISVTIKDRSDRDQKCKVVRYTCPSTGRVYVSGVPDNINKADEGMAWKFDLTEEEYEKLQKEA